MFSSKISFRSPTLIIILLISILFKTTVNGACVLEKKQVVIGPNNGYIASSVMGSGAGDGPKIKFVIGDKMASIGDVIQETVSKNIYHAVYYKNIGSGVLNG